MIIKNEPLSMAETLEYARESKDKETDVIGFIKKFTKIKPEEAKEIRKKLNVLDLIKVKEEHISKVIDVLPKTAEEINKIFSDVNLDEDEIKKILEVVKDY